MIFDKTGTLTLGKLKIDDIVSFDGKTKNEVLEIAAAVSSVSSHPIAGKNSRWESCYFFRN